MTPLADQVLDEIEAGLAEVEQALPDLKRRIAQRPPASSPRRSFADLFVDVAAAAPFSGASTSLTRQR